LLQLVDENRVMCLADQLGAYFLVFRFGQQRRDESFSAVESSPQNVVLSPNLVQKCAEVMQRRAGEFLSTIRFLSLGAFVDQTRRIFRTDTQNIDNIRLADFSSEQNRKTDLIEIVKLAEVTPEVFANRLDVFVSLIALEIERFATFYRLGQFLQRPEQSSPTYRHLFTDLLLEQHCQSLARGVEFLAQLRPQQFGLLGRSL